MRVLWMVVPLVAVACGRADSDNRRPVAQIADPGVVVINEAATLDGSPSYDPDNYHPDPPHGIVGYEWSIVAAPSGSTAGLGAATTSQVLFTPDVAGEYTVSLVVRDDAGAASDPATLTLDAIPVGTTLHVELTWDIDFSDANLHLVNATDGGVWFDSLDCYYQNMAPDWGPSGPVGDPELDADVQGFGPENITIGEPETDQVEYKIVVRYFSDNGVGGTNARVRVSDGKSDVADVVENLNSTGRTWVVGTVTMPDVIFTPDGTLYDCADPGTCPAP